MKVELKGKVALVTGAAQGIGLAIADILAENEAHVIYTDINIEKVRAAAARWPNATAIQLDVADIDQVEKVVSKAVRLTGRLDILVNNAGVNTLDHRVNIDNFPPEEWHRILNIDLTGLFFVSRMASRPMIQQKSGRIINISSVVGLVPMRLQSPFVAAKAGVVNLTKSMALELGPQGILVNAIAPGSIVTESTSALFYGENAKYKDGVNNLLAHIPLGRPGTPKEIAHAALFLVAPESSYINGHVLTVDGGWTAGYTREL
jgi:NAD(P)-dependent dehydrogenase (short-subunit alcohol dehydrogenase family)